MGNVVTAVRIVRPTVIVVVVVCGPVDDRLVDVSVVVEADAAAAATPVAAPRAPTPAESAANKSAANVASTTEHRSHGHAGAERKPGANDRYRRCVGGHNIRPSVDNCRVVLRNVD